MTKFLIFDTETSGLPDYAKPADADGQPRLAEFASILFDEDAPEVLIRNHLYIRPEGWQIAPEMEPINGLTQDFLTEHGVPVGDVLSLYTYYVDSGVVVVTYNAQYDTKVMRGEMRRAGIDDRFEKTPNICLMRSCGGLGIEKAGEKKGGFPKLTDAYRHFFDAEFDGPHRAPSDTEAAFQIFLKLREGKHLLEAKVHYAKNPPQKAAE